MCVCVCVVFGKSEEFKRFRVLLLCQLALVLGPTIAEHELLPIFDLFLRDDDKVLFLSNACILDVRLCS